MMTIEQGGEVYLTTQETCERLGTTRVTLNKLVKQKRLTRYRYGVRRMHCYKQDDVARLTGVQEDNNV